MISRTITCIFLFGIVSLHASAQAKIDRLNYKSTQNHMIAVYKGTVFVNGQRAYQFPEDNIVYKSKRNGLQEDKRNVYLFLEVTDGSNKNKVRVFNINYSKADSLLTAIASDVKDYDRDGWLEFGGSEAAQLHPSADSLYYLPARFYEINKGAILFDEAYTETVDRKVNGVYIPAPLDKSGKCCISIPKKKR